MGPASAYEYTSHKSVSLLEISAEFARAYDQAARSRTLPVESVEGALESIMQQYDTDKSGNFSAPEVKAIVRDLIQSRARNTSISRHSQRAALFSMRGTSTLATLDVDAGSLWR